MKKLFFFLIAAIFSLQAHAWDGTNVGVLTLTETTEGSGYDFRVTIGTSSHCGSGGASWAYINKTDANYNVFVAALLSARVLSSSIAVYTTKVGSYCHIGHVSF